jgi:hypothetical protein
MSIVPSARVNICNKQEPNYEPSIISLDSILVILFICKLRQINFDELISEVFRGF